jgi:hypothetical protein
LKSRDSNILSEEGDAVTLPFWLSDAAWAAIEPALPKKPTRCAPGSMTAAQK